MIYKKIHQKRSHHTKFNLTFIEKNEKWGITVPFKKKNSLY